MSGRTPWGQGSGVARHHAAKRTGVECSHLGIAYVCIYEHVYTHICMYVYINRSMCGFYISIYTYLHVYMTIFR